MADHPAYYYLLMRCLMKMPILKTKIESGFLKEYPQGETGALVCGLSTSTFTSSSHQLTGLSGLLKKEADIGLFLAC